MEPTTIIVFVVALSIAGFLIILSDLRAERKEYERNLPEPINEMDYDPSDNPEQK